MLPMNSSTNSEVAKPIPEETVQPLQQLTALVHNSKVKIDTSVKNLLKSVEKCDVDDLIKTKQLEIQEINNLILRLEQLEEKYKIKVDKPIPQETSEPLLLTARKRILRIIKEIETSSKDMLKAVEEICERIDNLIKIEQLSQEVNNLMLELEHDQLKAEDNIEVAKPIPQETVVPLLLTAQKDFLKAEQELGIVVEDCQKIVKRLSEKIDYLTKKEKFKLWGLSIPEIPGLRSLILKACRTGYWNLCKRVIEEQLEKSSILYKQLRDVRECSRLPWEIACRGYMELLNVLLENGLPLNLAKPTGYNETMLHISARTNQISVARFLIAMGADVNVKDSAGNTPLHDAAQNGYIDVAKLLLENKALINAINNKKETPLHYAVQNLHVSIVEYLVDCRCNKLAIDRNKRTALDIAECAFRRSKDSFTFCKFRQIIQILNSC